MNNRNSHPGATQAPLFPASALLVALTGVLLLALSGSCSTVFRSSIQGTIIDLEDYNDGTTTGVGDAKVFLYTDLAARDEDFAAYVNGNESTLPDGQAELKYFQSTVTDADGGYDFTGFIWQDLFPVYGKTADRKEVYLLIYHPDYGLWRSPVALYVVSDVTNQLDLIKIEDLWNQGRLAGTVLDWSDDEPLDGVAVNFYVASSWTYDAAGVIDSAVYPNNATATATTDADGRWTADLRFRKMPDRTGDKGTAPVRVVYVLNNYRVNDDNPGDTGLTTVNAAAGLVTNVDLDRDGATAAAGDYEDAFVVATAEVESDTHIITTLPDITMQRWRFSASVNGSVVEDGISPPNGIDGVTVTMIVADETYTADTAPTDTANSTESGRFNLGTVTWLISDIDDPAKQMTGETDVTMSITGITYTTVSGFLTSLLPDAQRSITIKVTP
jgi:hypothetical protein